MTGLRERLAPPRLRTELRALAAALAFLTRVPIGRRIVVGGDDVARAGPALPAVGAGVGGAVGGIAAALAQPLSPLLAVALALAAGTVLTGALHLDALADTADALGARSREHALAVMRDHAIGAYGAVAIVLDLLIKAAALGALVDDGRVLRVAVAAGALSRLTPSLLAAALPSARAGAGLGASLTRAGRGRAAVAGAVAVAIAVGVVGAEGAVLAACAVAVAALLGFAVHHRLGGVTGDILGATIELSELAVLVVAVALRGAG